MKLLLVRHGETVDNVAGLYAGISDSPLTNHGMVQARKLGRFLYLTETRIERIFSSDLQRAYLTAQAICESQKIPPAPVVRLALLREKSFGRLERTKISKVGTILQSNLSDLGPSRGPTEMSHDPESTLSMRFRAESFINNHLVPSLQMVQEDATIAVVSHGIFLSHLWRELLKRFTHDKICVSPTLSKSMDTSLDSITTWYNTAYLELCITRFRDEETHKSIQTSVIDKSTYTTTPPQRPELPITSFRNDHTQNECPKIPNNEILSYMQLTVISVNRRDHLDGVRKLRSGTGNLKYVPSQRTMYSYFVKKD
ncbi:putative phosphatase [Golovinomyces cichoracearum]|uniref:Putative phosphatase n=1 Tax=Golovinomyces cichoracearum TaxID=62708 RepID=A0A420I8N0_9PEZI|nr:putative phosphatase [Golovinomyces cichoracearum]